MKENLKNPKVSAVLAKEKNWHNASCPTNETSATPQSEVHRSRRAGGLADAFISDIVHT